VFIQKCGGLVMSSDLSLVERLGTSTQSVVTVHIVSIVGGSLGMYQSNMGLEISLIRHLSLGLSRR